MSSAQDIMGHHGISRTATKVDVRFRPELNDPMAVLFIWLTRNHYRSTVQSRGWGRSRSLDLSLPSRRRKRITGSRPGADSRGGRSFIAIRKSTSFFNKLCQRENLTVDCRCPCLTCTVKIAQVGISEVVYSQGYNMDNDVSQCLSVMRLLVNLI